MGRHTYTQRHTDADMHTQTDTDGHLQADRDAHTTGATEACNLSMLYTTTR